MAAAGLDGICIMRGYRGMLERVVGRGAPAVGSKIDGSVLLDLDVT